MSTLLETYYMVGHKGYLFKNKDNYSVEVLHLEDKTLQTVTYSLYAPGKHIKRWAYRDFIRFSSINHNLRCPI